MFDRFENCDMQAILFFIASLLLELYYVCTMPDIEWWSNIILCFFPSSSSTRILLTYTIFAQFLAQRHHIYIISFHINIQQPLFFLLPGCIQADRRQINSKTTMCAFHQRPDTGFLHLSVVRELTYFTWLHRISV